MSDFDWGGTIEPDVDKNKKVAMVYLGNFFYFRGDSLGVSLAGKQDAIRMSWEGWDKIVYAMNKVKIAQGEKE